MTIRPSLVRGLALGVVAAAALAGVAFLMNRGSQVRLDGSILKVRAIATDDAASIAVVDLRLANPARALFLVRETGMVITTARGEQVEGKMVAQPDLDRVLAYYPATGPRFNPVLRVREKFHQNEGGDRTLAAYFPVSEASLSARRELRVRITDADGAVIELVEGPRR